MFIDDKGIVLQIIKYDEKSFIVHLFTASHGYVSYMITASHGKRSGSVTRLYQPLSFLSFQWNMKPNASLYRMKDVRLLFVQQEIPYHPVKRAMAMLLGEFMAHALRGESNNASLYDYIENSFMWFDAASGDYANFHIVFLLKMSRFLGIAPNLENFEEGMQFDLERGICLIPQYPSSALLNRLDSLLFYRLANANYTTMSAIPMNKHDRVRLLYALGHYYALHIPGFPSLNSLDIVRHLFDE